MPSDERASSIRAAPSAAMASAAAAPMPRLAPVRITDFPESWPMRAFPARRCFPDERRSDPKGKREAAAWLSRRAESA